MQYLKPTLHQKLQINITKNVFDWVKVHIVITTKHKYACINYDFDTLNNAKQYIKNLSK